MCGIAGIIALGNFEVSVDKVKKMTDIIAHRGPDGEGHWANTNGQVILGHRRLSIIDLSHDADQPMHYLNRYTLTFNGEIYNYIELREGLVKQGYSFKTASDTEVLLALYDKHGEQCLQMLDGMFAFVIYDNKQNEIFAARDRFGEKPFFYSYTKGSHFLFGSEMKCLWAAGIEKKVNNRMLFNYLANGQLSNFNDPSETFYENCIRLPHGHCLKVHCTNCELSVRPYYDINWNNIDHSITEKQASEQLHELFYTSVSRRLRSDVTVGSSLSGGLDSSLVVAVIDNLKKGSNQKQETFSAVFPGFLKDERKYMDYVISRTNVSPHFITPDDEGLIKDINDLTWHQEEPYGSASIYVQYCIMRLAKENNVTVLLDGQGADEILAGYHYYYNTYFKELKRGNPAHYASERNAYNEVHKNNQINSAVRRTFADRVKSVSGSYTPALRKLYRKFGQFSSPNLSPDFYNQFKRESFETNADFTSLNQVLYYNTFQIGLQDLLRYSDRNSMAHSREVRLPYLSHELVEFLFKLPAEMKIHNGWTKWIMRQTFNKELPAEIAWRKDKIGYEPPQRSWMGRPEITHKITEAKKNLVNNGILLKAELDKPVVAEACSENKGNNWKYWMAGEMMK